MVAHVRRRAIVKSQQASADSVKDRHDEASDGGDEGGVSSEGGKEGDQKGDDQADDACVFGRIHNEAHIRGKVLRQIIINAS